MAVLSFYRVIIATVILQNLTASLAAGDNFFCGTSWTDASTNCDYRQPCPGATDDECTQPGHVCYGDTLCSTAAGHGEQFKFIAIEGLADVPYEHKSNRMFCGGWWASAEQECSVATHCGSPVGYDKPCGGQGSCFETACHIQDIVELEFGDDWRDKVNSVSKMGTEDPRRKQYCGSSWIQASKECRQHCIGDDDDCPPGQKCFADTNCYYEEDLQPTKQPVPTTPPTYSPVLRGDQTNRSFCGSTWDLAIQNCTPDTHCRDVSDCEEGQSCYKFLPACNLADMGNKVDPLSQNNEPTSIQQMSNEEVDTQQEIQPVVQIIPDGDPDYGDKHKAKDWMNNPSDPKNFNFCGKHWDDAKKNCNVERHCPDMKCEDPELNCFVGLGLSADHCNAFDMHTGNTRAPTDMPTTLAPILVSLEEQKMEQTSNNQGYDGDGNDWKDNPADPRNFQFCGKDWGDAKNNCNIERHCPDYVCKDPGLSCFIHLGHAGASSCNAYDLYQAPTYMPTTLAPTQSPSFQPTTPFPSIHPTLSPSKITVSPTTSQPTTGRPTKPPSRQPTASPSSSTKVMTNSPTRKIHGLCAISFEVLRETYRTAQPCSNTNPCKTDEICFSNEELAATLTQSLSPTMSPIIDITPTDAPSPSSDSSSPTQSGDIDRGSISDESTTSQIQTLQSIDEADKSNSEYQSNEQHVVESKDQKQESEDDTSLDNPMDGTIFYCANTLKELEESCHTAQICDLANSCPAGLGCIQYDYCQHEESQQESDKTVNFDLEQGIGQELQLQHDEAQGKSEAEDKSALPNYSLDLCPVGLVGLHASAGDCQQYHECNDGLLEASHKCQVTFMFDNRQGKCVDKRIVNYNCESPITDAETLDIILHGADDCPKGLVGLYARFPDCSIFYECNDEILMEVRDCDPGFSFDNVEGGCILEELVDSNCYSGQINYEPPPISEDDDEQSTSYTPTSSTEVNNEGTPKKNPDEDKKMYVWLREYEKSSAAMTCRAYWLAALLLSSIALVFQNC